MLTFTFINYVNFMRKIYEYRYYTSAKLLVNILMYT